MSLWKGLLGSIPALIVILGISYITSGGLGDFTNAILAWATLMLAVAAFLTIRRTILSREQERREERHRLALERIRGWAEEAFSLATRPTRYTLIEARKSEIVVLLHLALAKSLGILKDAERVGGNVHLSVRLAHGILFKFDARAAGEERISEFKERFNIKDTIEPIRNRKELEEQKRELLEALSLAINSATEQLVPLP